MKIRSVLLVFAALALASVFQSCLKDSCTSTRKYVRFDPIYKTAADIKAMQFAVEAARPLKSPGKFYVFDNYLFINEVREGIHIFDNHDPANPTPVSFLKIEGNVDMAIRGNKLYADQYSDLLTFDISDLQNPKLLCRSEGVFHLFGFDQTNGYTVDYVATNVTETVDCADQRYNQNYWFEGGGIFVVNDAVGPVKTGGAQTGAGAAVAQATGKSGSFTRFCIVDNYLYAVDNTSLIPFQQLAGDCPTAYPATGYGWNLETIFPWNGYLFIGSNSNVYVYKLDNPQVPTFVCDFWHANGCDPVICDEKYAYVTVHGGTACNQFQNNTLDIVDISKLPTATKVATYNMSGPQGLALTEKHLFICDDGLKIFDKADVTNLKLLAHLPNIKVWDAIALSETDLLLIGEDGYFQYDVSDAANPRQISHIPVIH